MKKLPLILSIISLAGVLGLYILYFSSSEEKIEEPEELTVAVDSLTSQQLGFPVAYIDVDTISEQYKFIQKMRKDLESQYKSAQAKYQGKLNSYQKKAAEFQKDVAMVAQMQQNGALSEQELLNQRQALENRQQLLFKDQENIAKLEQKLQQQLSENQAKLSKEMYDNIQGFISKYSSELNYSYVLLKGGISSSVLYGADSLDITNKLIDVLNAEYDASLVNEATEE